VNAWLQLQKAFQRGESFISHHCLHPIALFAATDNEYQGLPEQIKAATWGVCRAWVGPGHSWFIYGFTEIADGSIEQNEKRRKALFRFRKTAADAGTELLISPPANLPGEAWDETDAWLSFMWKHDPPDEEKWENACQSFPIPLRVVWPQPFLTAARVIEKSGLLNTERKPGGQRRRPGRKPRQPDKLDEILKGAIDRNEPSVMEHRWKDFVSDHTSELPKHVTSNMVRGRYRRLQAHA